MANQPGQSEVLLALAAAWAEWVTADTTDSELDGITSQFRASLTELRDRLPDPPLPDISRIGQDIADRAGRHRRFIMVDHLTRLAAGSLGVVARESGQPLAELLEESMPWHPARWLGRLSPGKD